GFRGLLSAEIIERNIPRALQLALRVPFGFTMANIIDCERRHASVQVPNSQHPVFKKQACIGTEHSPRFHHLSPATEHFKAKRFPEIEVAAKMTFVHIFRESNCLIKHCEGIPHSSLSSVR